MHPLLEWILSNAAVAGALAALAYGSVLLKRPAVTHVLRVLVLIKLLTPPVARFPVLRAELAPAEARGAQPAPATARAAPTRGTKTPLPIDQVVAEVEPLPSADASPAAPRPALTAPGSKSGHSEP